MKGYRKSKTRNWQFLLCHFRDPYCHSRESGNPAIEIMNKTYYVYILASKRNGTLYIGLTNNLEKRVYEHKNNIIEGFTSKYGVHLLVYYEQTNDVNIAIQREKQLKKWNRRWKLELIEKSNPNWNDLSKDWIPDLVGDDRDREER